MNRRSIAINAGLAAALVAVIAVGLASIGSPSSASAGADATATVRTADLSATVSATGNVSSATDVAVNFQGTGGTVTAIYVTPGQKVVARQRLAAIDDTSARQSLASARANLAAAQAQYKTTTQGQTSAEQTSTNAQIAAQRTVVDNAQNSVNQAKDSRSLNAEQQAANVDAARDAVRAAQNQLAKDQAANPPNPTTIANDQNALSQAESSLTAAKQQQQSTG